MVGINTSSFDLRLFGILTFLTENGKKSNRGTIRFSIGVVAEIILLCVRWYLRYALSGCVAKNQRGTQRMEFRRSSRQESLVAAR
jgi:hypothetical protein